MDSGPKSVTAFWKVVAAATGIAFMCGAALLWPVYQRKAAERKLAGTAVEMRARAEQGDAKAQYALGYSSFYGRGVPKDDAAAVLWYRKAAEQGYAKAQYALGFMYHTGRGVARDDAEAYRWDGKAADQGYAMAQCELGTMYYHGQGVPVDDVEAIRWYRKAAEQGDTEAQSFLGFLYFHGHEVPQDYAEAVRWYRKAGDQGDKGAQGFLMVIYFRGQGVPRSYIESLRWLSKVAASCFVGLERGPLARGTFLIAILLGLLIMAMPRRWLGTSAWLLLLSALFAVVLIHELQRAEPTLVKLGELFGTTVGGFGRVLTIALFGGLAAFCAGGAVVEAARAAKREGNPA